MKMFKKLYWKYKIYFESLERHYDFIWGVSACGAEASLGQANLIEILYDKKRKKYILGLETAFFFAHEERGECEYLKEMLDKFTQFMVSSNYDTNYEYPFFCCQPETNLEADLIEELYFDFSVFVKGYCAMRGEINEI